MLHLEFYTSFVYLPFQRQSEITTKYGLKCVNRAE